MKFSLSALVGSCFLTVSGEDANHSAALSTTVSGDPTKKYWYWKADYYGCVRNPYHTNNALDKCSTDSDPAGCTGGRDAADRFCKTKLGATALHYKLSTKGGVDHTWSIGKDHENFCLGMCECLSFVECSVNNHDWTTVDMCLENVYSHSGGMTGKTTWKGTYKTGSWSESVITKTSRDKISSTLSASVTAYIPGMTAKVGASTTAEVENMVSSSLTERHEEVEVTDVTAVIDLSKPAYIYRGKTILNMVTDGPITFKGHDIHLYNKPLKNGCYRLTYSRRRASLSAPRHANDTEDIAGLHTVHDDGSDDIESMEFLGEEDMSNEIVV